VCLREGMLCVVVRACECVCVCLWFACVCVCGVGPIFSNVARPR
jgi:hypothetical protein